MKSYQQFEKIGPNVELGLKISYDELILTSNLIELDFDSMFKTNAANLEDLSGSNDFLSELSERELVASRLFNTKELAHLLEIDIQYIFLFSRNDEQNIEPVYILIQSPSSDIKMYYSSKDINRFHEKLSSRIIKVNPVNDPNNSYIYRTSNAGRNWALQNTEKENNKYKKNLYAETLMKWLNANEIEILVTN
ncbi:MAG: hypothetical protein ACC656_02165 [Candidatus Heimdallarchaeota archaeon]